MARERLATTRLSTALAGGQCALLPHDRLTAPERASEQLEALKVCGAALKSVAGLLGSMTMLI